MSRILFFGGKGGVGKTSCSGAFAYARASEGNKVLLVSTDPAHSVSDLFERKIGGDIVELKPNLYATEINPEEESEKYFSKIRASIRQVYSVVIIEEINKQLDAAKLSPGTSESALFDRMVEIINETSEEYDFIVFDTAPTGHTLRLLTLPELLSSWVDVLLSKRRKTVRYKEMISGDRSLVENDEIVKILTRRKRNLTRAREILIDSGKLGFVFVLNAEKLAIDETIKATRTLRDHNIPIAAYVVNRLLPEEVSGEFWMNKKKDEAKYLALIESEFKGSKIYKIPLLSTDIKEAQIDVLARSFMNK
ncbi:MAG TPA: ArsA family ATPase [Bacillota bacterium]|nr:ArsA family ATPase [Bacillota bacterium]